MIELFQNVVEDNFQIVQINDHAGDRVNVPSESNLKQVIVSVSIDVVAEAKDVTIFGIIPLGIVITVGGTEFQAFGQCRFSHRGCAEKKQRAETRMLSDPSRSPLRQNSQKELGAE